MTATRRRTRGATTRYALFLRTESGTERRIAEITARNDGHAQELARKAGYGAAVRVAPADAPQAEGDETSSET